MELASAVTKRVLQVRSTNGGGVTEGERKGKGERSWETYLLRNACDTNRATTVAFPM